MAASVFLGPFVTLVSPTNQLPMDKLRQQAEDAGFTLSSKPSREV